MEPAVLNESRFGTGINTAVNRDFFQYFHMRVSRQEQTSAGFRFGFAPEAAQFRERVAITADVTEQGRFIRLELAIDRSVIDDGDSETSARDIVKSFLADATPLEDVAHIASWINDIRMRQGAMDDGVHIATAELPQDEMMDLLKRQLEAGKKVSVWTGQGESEPLAEAASPAFEVFKGDRAACEIRLSACQLRLENTAGPGPARLRVSLTAQPALAA